MNDFFKNKLKQEQQQLESGWAGARSFRAATHEDQLISDSLHLVHKLKARDSSGRWAYYFVLVSPSREAFFLSALNGDKTINLARYGSIIASNYGERPSTEVINLLKTRFGWDLNSWKEQ